MARFAASVFCLGFTFRGDAVETRRPRRVLRLAKPLGSVTSTTQCGCASPRCSPCWETPPPVLLVSVFLPFQLRLPERLRCRQRVSAFVLLVLNHSGFRISRRHPFTPTNDGYKPPPVCKFHQKPAFVLGNRRKFPRLWLRHSRERSCCARRSSLAKPRRPLGTRIFRRG